MQDSTPAPNPLVAARTARDISRKSLALALGKSYSSITAVEVGNMASIPESWASGLAALGIGPFGELQAAYLEWRKAAAAVAQAGA